VQQVIDICKDVTGKAIPVIDGERRQGDPDVLVSDSALMKKELGWKPQYPRLEQIVRHAWQWGKRADGF
jgi:UDP-glucose 4-epimerase